MPDPEENRHYAAKQDIERRILDAMEKAPSIFAVPGELPGSMRVVSEEEYKARIDDGSKKTPAKTWELPSKIVGFSLSHRHTEAFVACETGVYILDLETGGIQQIILHEIPPVKPA